MNNEKENKILTSPCITICEIIAHYVLYDKRRVISWRNRHIGRSSEFVFAKFPELVLQQRHFTSVLVNIFDEFANEVATQLDTHRREYFGVLSWYHVECLGEDNSADADCWFYLVLDISNAGPGMIYPVFDTFLIRGTCWSTGWQEHSRCRLPHPVELTASRCISAIFQVRIYITGQGNLCAVLGTHFLNKSWVV